MNNFERLMKKPERERETSVTRWLEQNRTLGNTTRNFFKWLQEEANEGNKLKPCPFCGSNAVIVDEDHSVYADTGFVFREVRCRCCGARSSQFNDIEYAIDAWNKRHDGKEA